MKKRFEEWRMLTANTKQIAANALAAPMRVLDLPGFQDLEDKLLLYTSRRGEMSPELDRFINDLSKRTFGVTENETLFDNADESDDLPQWPEEQQETDDPYYAYEDQFETDEATDDETVVILLEHGIDFRDARGMPLRCTKLFCRQAEAAAKGIMGKMPDRAAAGLESWTKALERDAKQHMDKKRSI